LQVRSKSEKGQQNCQCAKCTPKKQAKEIVTKQYLRIKHASHTGSHEIFGLGVVMRRSDKEIESIDETAELIRKCQVCRIGMSRNDKPYIVPVSFGFSLLLH